VTGELPVFSKVKYLFIVIDICCYFCFLLFPLGIRYTFYLITLVRAIRLSTFLTLRNYWGGLAQKFQCVMHLSSCSSLDLRVGRGAIVSHEGGGYGTTTATNICLFLWYFTPSHNQSHDMRTTIALRMSLQSTRQSKGAPERYFIYKI
jgi:hypothetical protein